MGDNGLLGSLFGTSEEISCFVVAWNIRDVGSGFEMRAK